MKFLNHFRISFTILITKNNAMKVRIIDFLLWPVALLLLYIVTHLAFTGIFYGFEFFIRLITRLNLFLYVILVFSVMGIFVTPIYLLLSVLCGLIIGKLVRQWKSLLLVFGILLMTEIVIFLILFWIGQIDFGWESIRFTTLNKIIFTMMWISFIYVPPMIRASLTERNNN